MKLHWRLPPPLLLISTIVVGGKHLVCSFQTTTSIISSPIRNTTPLRQGIKSSEREQTKAKPQDESYFDWNQQWYPILPVSYLDDDSPVSITVLDEDLVVWKNKSGDDSSHDDVSVFLDCCPHRMAPLSTGKVVKNEETGSHNLACRYHGFEFNAKGHTTKIPMMKQTTDGTQSFKLSNLGMCARAYPTRTCGGLVYAFLGEYETEEDLPDIPTESIATKTEIENADWIFNVNPISYQGMMENTLDPTHAPFTHEGMIGFAGIPFSSSDIVPMEKFEASNFGIGGFTMSHTPYQLYTAQKGGFDKETQRTFIPPCTISVQSLPFFRKYARSFIIIKNIYLSRVYENVASILTHYFQLFVSRYYVWAFMLFSSETKMWFVPSTPTSMHVIAIIKKSPPSRIGNIAKFLDKTGSLSTFLDDFNYAMQYLSDYSYRFQSQDRMTMQGQDKRKWKLDMSQCLDLAPTVSDNGVATFQKWTQRFGGLGPFPFAPKFKTTSAEDRPDFDRELSIWDSHAKFNPRMKRILQSILTLQKVSQKCARVSFGALVSTALLPILRRKIPVAPIIASLVLSIGLIDWTRGMQRRFFGKGNETWQKSLAIWGS